jgi:hypothetical protein
MKYTLADQLRAEIVSGRLKPGSRIVEGTRATKMPDVPFCESAVLTSSELLLLGEYYKKSKYFKTL